MTSNITDSNYSELINHSIGSFQLPNPPPRGRVGVAQKLDEGMGFKMAVVTR